MMIFHPKMQKLPQEWADKINFVDENNVVLGYDDGQNCCEFWTWNVDREPGAATKSEECGGFHIDPSFVERHYVFDTTFFEESEGCATFKVVHKEDPSDVYYINLCNVHNGYYAHGFVLSQHNKPIKEGCI